MKQPLLQIGISDGQEKQASLLSQEMHPSTGTALPAVPSLLSHQHTLACWHVTAQPPPVLSVWYWDYFGNHTSSLAHGPTVWVRTWLDSRRKKAPHRWSWASLVIWTLLMTFVDLIPPFCALLPHTGPLWQQEYLLAQTFYIYWLFHFWAREVQRVGSVLYLGLKSQVSKVA